MEALVADRASHFEVEGAKTAAGSSPSASAHERCATKDSFESGGGPRASSPRRCKARSLPHRSSSSHTGQASESLTCLDTPLRRCPGRNGGLTPHEHTCTSEAYAFAPAGPP